MPAGTKTPRKTPRKVKEVSSSDFTQTFEDAQRFIPDETVGEQHLPGSSNITEDSQLGAGRVKPQPADQSNTSEEVTPPGEDSETIPTPSRVRTRSQSQEEDIIFVTQIPARAGGFKSQAKRKLRLDDIEEEIEAEKARERRLPPRPPTPIISDLEDTPEEIEENPSEELKLKLELVKAQRELKLAENLRAKEEAAKQKIAEELKILEDRISQIEKEESEKETRISEEEHKKELQQLRNEFGAEREEREAEFETRYQETVEQLTAQRDLLKKNRDLWKAASEKERAVRDAERESWAAEATRLKKKLAALENEGGEKEVHQGEADGQNATQSGAEASAQHTFKASPRDGCGHCESTEHEEQACPTKRSAETGQGKGEPPEGERDPKRPRREENRQQLADKCRGCGDPKHRPVFYGCKYCIMCDKEHVGLRQCREVFQVACADCGLAAHEPNATCQMCGRCFRPHLNKPCPELECKECKLAEHWGNDECKVCWRCSRIHPGQDCLHWKKPAPSPLSTSDAGDKGAVAKRDASVSSATDSVNGSIAFNECWACGLEYNYFGQHRNCPAINTTCRKCGQVGHIRSLCPFQSKGAEAIGRLMTGGKKPLGQLYTASNGEIQAPSHRAGSSSLTVGGGSSEAGSNVTPPVSIAGASPDHDVVRTLAAKDEERVEANIRELTTRGAKPPKDGKSVIYELWNYGGYFRGWDATEQEIRAATDRPSTVHFSMTRWFDRLVDVAVNHTTIGKEQFSKLLSRYVLGTKCRAYVEGVCGAASNNGSADLMAIRKRLIARFEPDGNLWYIDLLQAWVLPQQSGESVMRYYDRLATIQNELGKTEEEIRAQFLAGLVIVYKKYTEYEHAGLLTLPSQRMVMAIQRMAATDPLCASYEKGSYEFEVGKTSAKLGLPAAKTEQKHKIRKTKAEPAEDDSDDDGEEEKIRSVKGAAKNQGGGNKSAKSKGKGKGGQPSPAGNGGQRNNPGDSKPQEAGQKKGGGKNRCPHCGEKVDDLKTHLPCFGVEAQCYHCHEWGHIRRACPAARREWFAKKKEEEEAKAKGEGDAPAGEKPAEGQA